MDKTYRRLSVKRRPPLWEWLSNGSGVQEYACGYLKGMRAYTVILKIIVTTGVKQGLTLIASAWLIRIKKPGSRTDDKNVMENIFVSHAGSYHRSWRERYSTDLYCEEQARTDLVSPSHHFLWEDPSDSWRLELILYAGKKLLYHWGRYDSEFRL
jgi:hypothetical protein